MMTASSALHNSPCDRLVAFAYDFFRSPLLGQWDAEINARWLHALFAGLINQPGVQSHCFTEKGPTAEVPVLEILMKNGLDRSQASWLKMYSSPLQADCLYNCFDNCDLVVGFELAPSLIRYLSAKRIRYLDFSIDPVRFAPDLFFAVRTNDAHVEAELAKREVVDAELMGAAGLIRASLARICDYRQPFFAGATLFVGQCDVDASLIVDGELQTLAHCLDKLMSVITTDEALLLKPHPYGNLNENVRFLHKYFPSSLITTDNIYALLSSPYIDRVITLSSSVAKESEYFGKSATCLITPDKDSIEPSVVCCKYRIPLSQLDRTFWNNVIFQHSSERRARFLFSQGTLRSALGDNWAYSPGAMAARARNLEPGKSYTFEESGEGTAFLAFGWHRPEKWGVWSQGDLATLLVRPGSPDKACRISIQVQPFVVPGRSLSVTVSARGAMNAVENRFVFSDSNTHTLEIALDPAGERWQQEVELQINVDGALSPREAGVGSDDRILGIGLVCLSLLRQNTEVDSDAALEAPEQLRQAEEETKELQVKLVQQDTEADSDAASEVPEQLRQAEEETKELQVKLMERDAELGKILASHSWRITAPLRSLRKFVKS